MKHIEVYSTIGEQPTLEARIGFDGEKLHLINGNKHLLNLSNHELRFLDKTDPLASLENYFNSHTSHYRGVVRDDNLRKSIGFIKFPILGVGNYDKAVLKIIEFQANHIKGLDAVNNYLNTHTTHFRSVIKDDGDSDSLTKAVFGGPPHNDNVVDASLFNKPDSEGITHIQPNQAKAVKDRWDKALRDMSDSTHYKEDHEIGRAHGFLRGQYIGAGKGSRESWLGEGLKCPTCTQAHFESTFNHWGKWLNGIRQTARHIDAGPRSWERHPLCLECRASMPKLTLIKSIGFIKFPALGVGNYTRPVIMQNPTQAKRHGKLIDTLEHRSGLVNYGGYEGGGISDNTLHADPTKHRISGWVSPPKSWQNAKEAQLDYANLTPEERSTVPKEIIDQHIKEQKSEGQFLEAIGDHETQHAIFSQMRKKFGHHIHNAVIAHMVDNMPERHRAAAELVASSKGYNVNSTPNVFNEELLTAHQDYLGSKKMRDKVHRQLTLDNVASKNLQFVMKNSWQDLMKRGKSLTPEQVEQIKKEAREKHITGEYKPSSKLSTIFHSKKIDDFAPKHWISDRDNPKPKPVFTSQNPWADDWDLGDVNEWRPQLPQSNTKPVRVAGAGKEARAKERAKRVQAKRVAAMRAKGYNVDDDYEFGDDDDDVPTKKPTLNLQKMAIKDLIPGRLKPETAIVDGSGKILEGKYNYQHILPNNLRGNYSLTVHHFDNQNHGSGIQAELTQAGQRVGHVTGWVDKDKDNSDVKWIEPHSSLQPAHKKKGLGKAMYEALYAHAFHNMDIKHVKGGAHTPAASRVHESLARKHGLEYHAEPEPHGGDDELRKPYEYALKSEQMNLTLKHPVTQVEVGRITSHRLVQPWNGSHKCDKGHNQEQCKSYVKSLADKIKSGAKIKPVMLQERSGERHMILDGNHRVAAHRLAGVKTMPAHLYRQSEPVDWGEIFQKPEKIEKVERLGRKYLQWKLKKMAIKDIKPGQLVGESENLSGDNYPIKGAYDKKPGRDFNYSHVLTPHHRSQGLRLMVHNHNYGPGATARLYDDNKRLLVGAAKGWVTDEQALQPHSWLKDEYHGNKLGQAMYEALYAHAHHVLNINNVHGESHTDAAHRVHLALARKHGLEYSAKPNYKRKPDDTFNANWSPYKYVIKSEKHPFRAAAFRNTKTGQVIETGSFHDIFHPDYKANSVGPLGDYESGFVTHDGKFLDRRQAAEHVGGVERFHWATNRPDNSLISEDKESGLRLKKSHQNGDILVGPSGKKYAYAGSDGEKHSLFECNDQGNYVSEEPIKIGDKKLSEYSKLGVDSKRYGMT